VRPHLRYTCAEVCVVQVCGSALAMPPT